MPAGTSRNCVDLLQRVAEVAEHRLQPLQQPRPGVGRRDAAGGAVQQAHAQPLLQVAQQVADGGGRDAEFGRGPAEAAMGRHGDEGGEAGEVDPGHALVTFSQ